jgi:hypothetical protein
MMTTPRTFALTILVGIAFSLSSSAQAGSLYNNLGAVSDGTDPLIFLGPLADSFSTGAATTLNDVKLLLGTSFIDTSSSSVSLLSDNGTSPGSLIEHLGTISDSSLPMGSLAVVDFANFTPVALAANTRYWIELSSTDFSSAVWSFSDDISGPGVAGEFFSNDHGVMPDTLSPFQMRVNTISSSSVPEPSTLTLGVLGIGTLVVLRLRSYAKASLTTWKAGLGLSTSKRQIPD